jgi:hypothetical protein
MAFFQSTTFRNEKVELDGNEFYDCKFENCHLIYRGAAAMKLTNPLLLGSSFVFEDGARLTIDFIKVLYQNGFMPIIEELFDNIRTGNIPSAGGVGH